MIFPSFSFIHSQGSNNSDQSSGYLSGSGGSNSLPVNSNPLDAPGHFDYKYATQARLDGLNDKYSSGQGQKNDHQNIKKLSLTSSMNDFSTSNNAEPEMDYNNGHKWVMRLRGRRIVLWMIYWFVFHK